MYNPANEISDILSKIEEITTVSSMWPQQFEALPLVCYIITENSASITTTEGESISRIQASIHIFTDNIEQAESISMKINDELTSNYWKRVGYTHVIEPKEHLTLLYATHVDVETLEHFLL